MQSNPVGSLCATGLVSLLPQVRARRKESVQSCWRGREEESRRPWRVWQKELLFILFLVLSFPLFLQVIRVADSPLAVLPTPPASSKTRLAIQTRPPRLVLYCRCSPAAIFLASVLFFPFLFVPEIIRLIVLEVLSTLLFFLLLVQILFVFCLPC